MWNRLCFKQVFRSHKPGRYTVITEKHEAKPASIVWWHVMVDALFLYNVSIWVSVLSLQEPSWDGTVNLKSKYPDEAQTWLHVCHCIGWLWWQTPTDLIHELAVSQVKSNENNNEHIYSVHRTAIRQCFDTMAYCAVCRLYLNSYLISHWPGEGCNFHHRLPHLSLGGNVTGVCLDPHRWIWLMPWRTSINKSNAALKTVGRGPSNVQCPRAGNAMLSRCGNAFFFLSPSPAKELVEGMKAW